MNYDDWKCTEPDPWSYKEEDEDMTPRNDLESVDNELQVGLRHIAKALRLAVLGRERREAIENAERELYLIVDGIREELKYR